MLKTPKSKSSQKGFSLIELMIAVVVLAVGLVGGVAVISVAIANNGRSRFDTTATALAESTMERIMAIPSSASGTAAKTAMSDCAGNSFTIDTNVGGAALQTSGFTTGSVDFTQTSVPAGYSMLYVSCGTGNVYDVRWRIDPGPTPGTQLVTVSAKSTGQTGNGTNANQQTLFALPVTERSLRGTL